MSARLESGGHPLGPIDEPRAPGSVVAVHYGDYRRQEIWVSSGANVGNWYPLGGEFGRPRVAVDERTSMQNLLDPKPFVPPAGQVPQHPTWTDVLARGPVTLLIGADGEAYRRGWRAGRRDLWQAMEEVAEEDPSDVPSGD